MSVVSGTRFGFYEVLSPIGSGGMGEVYLAYDVRLGRRAALKLLPAKYTADEERVRRFQQEARAASALNHPNIITIFEIGQNHDTHFIATEFVEGQTVSKRLSTGKIEMSLALDIAIQASSAIAAAHAAGIIHRDIKCENIMIRPDGYVKVLDFGLAKLTETFSSGQNADAEAPTQPLNETSPGMIMGTVNYMSPEQARGYRVDARSDIFSMGIVLYEMLTGKLPFSGNSGSDVVAAILTQEAPPLSRYIADATPELEWIVSKALSKERDSRFQRADELVAALKRAKQQIDFRAEKERSDPATVIGETESLHQSSTGKTRRGRSYDTNRGFDSSSKTVFTQFGSTLAKRRKEAVVVVAMLLVAAALGAVYFWNSRKELVVNSIAIIPFSAANSTPQTALLADRMTQGLITSLSQLPKLRVRSLASVLRYKTVSPTATPPDPREVGLALDVPLILTGRFSENPEGLTINLELVDTRDNTFLWGKQYERKRADLPALQEEITREVSGRLKLDLNAEEMSRFEAYQSYLRGRYFLGRRTSADLRQGIESFEKAISLNGNFAQAYAGLADSYNLLGTYGSLDPNEAFPKARDAAEKALKIDDSLAEAHTSLAFVKHRYEWDWPGAEREFKRAIELDQNYAPARQWYASLLVAMGRSGRAIAEARRCQELDPVSLSVNSQLAWVLYLSRQYKEALAECEKIIAIDGNFFPARRYIGLVYEQLGRPQEAVIAFKKARELSRGSTVVLGALGHAQAVAGNTEEARRMLEELLAVQAPKRVPSYEVAIVYAGLGDTEQAFAWLEKAFNEKNEYLNYLMVDPRLDRLHGDPRYAALARRIGLPAARS
ncbi:MAG: protein kinase [Acidobacteriota bacterium]